ncbi:Hypothetical protein IALB_2721 [Ignavibacterium album JCM 16511]|uniref:Uncharacterized protein n=1 Tax=Ignavibacterium album (strain DSM 19864 / JCM 16511 / NBRC 101810 / Mat9-16) TaxID=945713 RepID=I0AN67_IGNAJ|nr:hypothetical protein [Ignavibacterium album]AFH50424.1 Hypothetical protein IALB_2721 [Ignavibacterium album JCM 16511]
MKNKTKKEKIKTRIPVPKKPPKVEEKPKAYKRANAKKETKKKIDEELK